MSKLEVNAIEPQCGTNLTLGASGDTIIIPSGATISNQGTAAGFGPTGAVSWDTTKITADPNPAVSGVGYFADTTSAAFTITLPSSPSAGAVVGISDYANTFATNNLTVGRNGSNIGGIADNAILSTNGLSITFVYVDATQGWIVTDSGNRSDLPVPEYIVATGGTITCDGDYKIHTFTGPGTFTVCSVGNSIGSDSVDYLVVAGGAAGGRGAQAAGGGGGAGGLRFSASTYTAPPTSAPRAGSALPVSAQGYPITIGGGGAGSSSNAAKGNNGNTSTFSSITSAGGGGGGSRNGTAGPGGSGGGGDGDGGTTRVGGTGNTPPTSPSQGNTGGSGFAPAGHPGGGGGGGGAVGESVPNGSKGGDGGVGLQINIDTNSNYWAGGGGGALWTNFPVPSTGGDGGLGGGGGGYQPGSNGTAGGGGGSALNTGAPGGPPNNGGPGGTNTGGGGGGSNNDNPVAAGSGGSGIVIIRYKFQ
jgi:hypothetical protein